MTETYTHERAGFAERAAKLAGRTAYREPVGGHGSRIDYVPDEHAIAAAFAYARLAPHDIGPDIAVAISTGTHAHARKIIVELAAALMAGLGRRADGYADAVIEVAADCYLRVITGCGKGKPEKMGDRPYEIAAALGDRILWQAADEAFFRAERAYRKDGNRPVSSEADRRKTA